MHTRFTVLMILLMALMLAACDSASPAQGTGGQSPTTAATPGAGGNRPANFTPGAQQPPFAQGTRQPNPQSALTPGAQRTPQAASASVPNSTPTPAPTTNNTLPTAVPIPQVVVPTQVPSSSQTDSTPTNSSNTSGSAPVSTPAPPTPTPSPTPTAVTSLDALRGKIVFFSDRGGSYPQLYVMNPDGSDQQLCNCSDLLQTMVTNDVSSPDMQQYLFVKQVGGGLRGGVDDQIWAHNNETNEDKPVTGGPPGFPNVDYDPAWSPDSKHIAWVSETNGYDEIYLYDRSTNENTRLTESHGEWYKHPSFSPDGSQITYWTNRADVNRKQIWVMNADGSQQHNISNNQYNDWDPIWVK